MIARLCWFQAYASKLFILSKCRTCKTFYLTKKDKAKKSKPNRTLGPVISNRSSLLRGIAGVTPGKGCPCQLQRRGPIRDMPLQWSLNTMAYF